MTVFVWDEAKRLANLAKHGYDFAHVEADFDWDDAVTAPTYAGSRREARFKSIGVFEGRLIVVIFAPLGTEAISIISMRPADSRERRLYEGEEER
ncbi:MAG: BrnT family toxin [Rhizobiales bacterium]|nr:BrnT family toxin [Hyphomicrobiales bacterium]MBN9010330.1 BrnT family toxin [Hyphomicrobiales bacterium]